MPDSNFTPAGVGDTIQTYEMGENNTIKATPTGTNSENFKPFLGLRAKIIQFGNEFNCKDTEFPQNFLKEGRVDIEDMKRRIKLFFSQMDVSLGEKMNMVENNYMIREQLSFDQNKPCYVKTKREGDVIIMEGNITPDARGLVALGQGIAECYVYNEFHQQEKKEDQERLEQIRQVTSKFFGLLIVKYMSMNSNLTPKQIEALEYDVIYDMSPNIMANPLDEKCVEDILKHNPNTFQKDSTPEEFLNDFAKIVENPNSGIPSQAITERMNTISEDYPTLYINTDEALNNLSALIAMGAFENKKDQADKKTFLNNIIKGVYCGKKLTEMGKTPEEIAQFSEAEIDTMIQQAKENELTEEQRRKLEEQNKEDPAPVLELVRQQNNPNNNQ